MFDDPKEKLQWLDEALRAAEYEQQELNDAFDDGMGDDVDEVFEDDEWMDDMGEDDLRPMSNPAVDFGRMISYDDPEFDEDAAVLVERKPKKKGIGGLVFLALMELLGIVIIILWWLQWMA